MEATKIYQHHQQSKKKLCCLFLGAMDARPVNNTLGAIQFTTSDELFLPPHCITALEPIENSLSIEQWTTISEIEHHQKDAAAAQTKIHATFGDLNACYLEGDLCREALVVEIETTCHL